MARASERRRSISMCSSSFPRTGSRKRWPTSSARRGFVRPASSPGAQERPRSSRLSRRTSPRSWRELACAISTKPAFASPAAALTSYRVSAKRGDLPKGLRGGVIVHDHFKPYYALPAVRHALCNAHHLRELKAPIDIDKEQWAGQMRDLLLDANESVRAAVALGATALSTPVLRTLIKRYNAIVRRGLAFHRNLPPLARGIGARGRAPHRPGHNLLIRLH